MLGYGMAVVQLETAPVSSDLGSPQRITVTVWNRSYDHPDPAKRNSLLWQLKLLGLEKDGCVSSLVWSPTFVGSVDCGGGETSLFWLAGAGPTELSLDGYTEHDDPMATMPGVQWGVMTGLYDERCAAEAACDANRVRSRITLRRLFEFNYLARQSVFTFQAPILPPAIGVNLRFANIGGNNGVPDGYGDSAARENFRVSFGLDFGP